MPHTLMTDNKDLATSIEILDKWIERRMFKNHQPGMAVGIVYDGELLWGKGYGVADVEAQTPVMLDTRFRIASITKTFTATAIMQLRDAGQLSLDDPVSKHLEWFDLRYDGAPEITIRNLLTHSSGLPRDSHEPMWTAYDAPEWDDFVEATKQRQPTRPPYAKFAYSNLGYSLLGGIIHAVSGQAWADYLQQHILDPLGMTETYPIPDREDELLATGYSRLDDEYNRAPFPFFLMNGFEASANFSSSVNDLVKYAKFHLGKEESAILSSHTLRDMHRVHWLQEDWDNGYGLGLGIYKINHWTLSGHSGGYPGYLTEFSLSREHNVAVILLTNAIDSNPFLYIEQCYKLVMPEIIKATEQPKSDSDPVWEKYLGEYISDWSLDKVVIRNKQLQIISLDWVDAPTSILEPTDEPHVFTLQGKGQSNETVRFEFDDDGQVINMRYRNEISTRKS